MSQTVTTSPSVNGQHEASTQRVCPQCSTAFTPGSGYGRFCSRRCAYFAGRGLATLETTSNLVQETLPRLVAEALPGVVHETLPKVLPDCLTTGLLNEVLRPFIASVVAEALSAPIPEPQRKPEKPQSYNRSAQAEGIERLEEALNRKLLNLPHDWKRIGAVREPGGSIRVEVVY